MRGAPPRATAAELDDARGVILVALTRCGRGGILELVPPALREPAGRFAPAELLELEREVHAILVRTAKTLAARR